MLERLGLWMSSVAALPLVILISRLVCMVQVFLFLYVNATLPKEKRAFCLTWSAVLLSACPGSDLRKHIHLGEFVESLPLQAYIGKQMCLCSTFNIPNVAMHVVLVGSRNNKRGPLASFTLVPITDHGMMDEHLNLGIV